MGVFMKNKKIVHIIVKILILIAATVGVILLNPIIETREIYRWAQSLDAERINEVTLGSYSLNMEEKEELVKIIKRMSRSDFSLIDLENAIMHTCDYRIYFMIDGKELLMWHSYIPDCSLVVQYNAKGYAFDCEALSVFWRKIIEKSYSDK